MSHNGLKNLDELVDRPLSVLGVGVVLYLVARTINIQIAGAPGEWTVVGMAVGSVAIISMVAAAVTLKLETLRWVVGGGAGLLVAFAAVVGTAMEPMVVSVAEALFAATLLVIVASGISLIVREFEDWYLPSEPPEERVL